MSRLSPDKERDAKWEEDDIFTAVAPTKANTTSTMFVDSTIAVPNNEALLFAISSLLTCQISDDSEQAELIMKRKIDRLTLFDENTYRHSVSVKTISIPTQEAVYKFLKPCWEVAQFSPECNILALIYVLRILGITKMPLHSRNYRLLMLTGMLVAQKVWDDKCLGNVDFPVLWKFVLGKRHPTRFGVKEMNHLERRFLQLLQFNVGVKSSLYTKYYFELRSLGGMPPEREVTALGPEEARRLEIRSATASLAWPASPVYGLAPQDATPKPSRGTVPAKTFEDATLTPSRARAVLS